MRVLKTALGEVLDVAFSPDCRAVAAAGPHGAFLWNLDSPALVPVRLEVAPNYQPGGLCFGPGGRRLSWQAGNVRYTYDRDDRATSATALAFWPTTTTAAAFCAAGERAVSNHGIPDHALFGWRWKEGEWVRQWKLPAHELSVGSLTLAPGGGRFAIFTRATEGARWWEGPMRLEVRDAATSALLATGGYPYSYAGQLAFHPRGDQIAALNGMTLVAWALPAGGEPRLVQSDNRKHFTALAYHPDGRRLFVTSNDETVHVFDTHALDRVNRYTWQLDRLGAVALSADGTLAAAGSANGDVVVWDLE
jgi:YD repeat-containing protein